MISSLASQLESLFRPLLLILQRWLATHRSLWERLFLLLELALGGLYMVGAYLFLTDPSWQVPLYLLGLKFGTLAVILYLITLVPGILKRLQLFPMTAALLTTIRRHLGILMFLSAFIHAGFTTTLLIIASKLPPVLVPAQGMGMVALSICFGMWLTSNEVSVRAMGRYWKWLHRLTYIALFFIFLHLAFFRKEWAIPAFGFLIAEVVSWIAVWRRSRTSAQLPPATQVMSE